MEWAEVAKALFIGAPASLIAAGAYRRSRHVDAVSEQTGIATETRAGQAERRDAQNDLNENLQTDNKALRDVIMEMRREIKELNMSVTELTREINRLYRKYGENGTPPKGVPPTLS
jgi:predicted RNase H-like nuclease (RuvC/YqgF family)